jgi:hypothetical protein
MSQFWIETNPTTGVDVEVFQLTVTTDFKIDYPSEVSSHPVVDRREVSDNYIRKNITVTVNGMLSNIKNYLLSANKKPQRDVSESLNFLTRLREKGETFTLHLEDQLDPLVDCVFTSLVLNKESSFGSSYDISIEIKQIIPSKQVSLSLERFIQSNNDQSGSKTSGAGAATKELKSESLGVLLARLVPDLFT